MAKKKNKVKYNLRNVHVAKCTVTTNDVTGDVTYTYGTPRALPGAVNLSLSAEGESSPFYADGIVYFRSDINNGYSGDLEIALVPDWFRTEILKDVKDSNGVMIETADVTEAEKFALLFEFDGDVKAIRHVMYLCSVTRPDVASQTKEDTIEPVTETLSLTCDARADGMVKARTSDDTKSATYAGWYNAVYERAAGEYSPALAKLVGITVGSLTLNPVFDSEVLSYSATTENASDTVSAVAATGNTVAITVNGTAHTSGTAATWESGNNIVLITVSPTDSESDVEEQVYSVAVNCTYEAPSETPGSGE